MNRNALNELNREMAKLKSEIEQVREQVKEGDKSINTLIQLSDLTRAYSQMLQQHNLVIRGISHS